MKSAFSKMFGFRCSLFRWLRVVYFDQLLGVARTQKLVELLFSAVFNLFCSFQTFFSDFTAEIKKKSEKEQKTCFCLLLRAGQHAKASDSLRGYLEIVFFRLIFCSFSDVFC